MSRFLLITGQVNDRRSSPNLSIIPFEIINIM